MIEDSKIEVWSRPHRVRCAIASLVVVLASIAGCPETTRVSTDRCDHVGAACQLPNGTLGLCSESLAAACAHPPCLACTPQH